jgi:hypothetical protein
MVSRRLRTVIFVCSSDEYGLYNEFSEGIDYDKSKRSYRSRIENSKFLVQVVRAYKTRGWKALVLFDQDCQSVESARMRLTQLMLDAAVDCDRQRE